MTERPILFSGPMVRAILEGRKTQTRRIVKPQPPQYINELHGDELSKRAPYALECNETGNIVGSGFQDDNDALYKCPYGTVGDRLWVREAFHKISGNTQACVYRASCENGSEKNYKFTPSIHMPRWASRITLGITGVRVERLQDISEADAIAEGCEPVNPITDNDVEANGPCAFGFKLLWQSIYGPDSWDENPWVWVLDFEKMENDA